MRRAGLILCIVTAACIAGIGGWRAVRNDWPTAARPLAWTDRHGASIAAPEDCHLGDLGRLLVIHDRALLVCTHGLAELRPAEGTARVYLESPSLELLDLVGVAPNPSAPDREVAVLVRASQPGGPLGLAVGVIGPAGWDVPLRIVEPDGALEPLAFVWRGDAQELVVATRVTERTAEVPAARVLVLAGVIPSVRAFTPPCDSCWVVGAFIDDAGAWTAIVPSDSQALLVTETAVVPAPPAYAAWNRVNPYEVDRAALGVVGMIFGPAHIQRPDGTLAAVPEPPVPGAQIASDGRYQLAAGSVQKLYRWYLSDSYIPIDRVGDRIAFIEHGADDRSTIGFQPGAPVTVVDDEFVGGGFLFRQPGGGFTWFQFGGDFVQLDADLVRTDRLSVREHLRRQQAYGANDPNVYLYFVLAGFPVALLLGTVWSLLSGRGAVRLGPVAAWSGAYAFLGLLCLRHLMPLLGGWRA